MRYLDLTWAAERATERQIHLTPRCGCDHPRFARPGKGLPSLDPYPMHPLSCHPCALLGTYLLEEYEKRAALRLLCFDFEPRTSPDLVLELCNPCTCMHRRGALVLEGQPLGPSLTPLPLPLPLPLAIDFGYKLTRLNCILQLQSTLRRRSAASIRMLLGRCIDHVRHQEALMPGLCHGQSPPIHPRGVPLLKNLPLHENSSDLEQMSRFFAHFSAFSSSLYLRFKLSAFVSSHHHVSSAV